MRDSTADQGSRTLHPVVTAPAGRTDVTHVAGQAYAVFVREHELTVDQPVGAGGDNDGPTPVELFVSSFATCVAYYAGRFLQRHRLPYESVLGVIHPPQVAPVGARYLIAVDRLLQNPRELTSRTTPKHWTSSRTRSDRSSPTPTSRTCAPTTRSATPWNGTRSTS
ncbi:OsmC family protein [Streptomyces sp. NPDC041068]|uniref:OsmC family protein n=1 Tax=Streptomyces sp. NPDC041068 TaxID=3155130 RepID=UPI0033DDF09D